MRKDDCRYDWFYGNPVIAAVRDEATFARALKSSAGIIFLLQTDIINAPRLVAAAREADKKIFIHVDFLSGITADAKGVEYIAKVIRSHGIISTRPITIRTAAQQGLFTVQRVFLLDSLSVKTAISAVDSARPDVVEIMPGIMHTVTSQITRQLDLPVIAGGLISQKSDVVEAIKAGAAAVSTGMESLWEE